MHHRHSFDQSAQSRLSAWIDARRGEMVADLQSLCQIPSVKSDPEPGRPFGPAVAQALGCVLKRAQAFGMRTKDVDGYAVHGEIGEGRELVGVLSHVDVVPAGNGWTLPPFGAVLRDGRVYARGAVDDKGPTVAALYAVAAVAALGLPLRRRVRLIVGGDEESGFSCVRHYFEHEEMPTLGFSPDAMFPLVHAEKGSFTVRLTADWPQAAAQGGVLLEALEAGTRPNIVPDRAWARLVGSSEALASAAERLRLASEARPEAAGEITVFDDAVEVTTTGQAAHAMHPELGRNAIRHLAELLAAALPDLPGRPILSFLAGPGSETDGAGLGIACRDDVSGPLTSNLAMASLEGGRFEVTVNVRYPVREDGLALVQRLRATAAPLGLELHLDRHSKPHFLPTDHPLVRTLLDVYRAHGGGDEAPIAMGGGTYARVMPVAVAFGPLFPGQPEVAHEPDEHWAVDDLVRCAKIYADAIYRLAAE